MSPRQSSMQQKRRGDKRWCCWCSSFPPLYLPRGATFHFPRFFPVRHCEGKRDNRGAFANDNWYSFNVSKKGICRSQLPKNVKRKKYLFSSYFQFYTVQNHNCPSFFGSAASAICTYKKMFWLTTLSLLFPTILTLRLHGFPFFFGTKIVSVFLFYLTYNRRETSWLFSSF